MSGRRDYIHDLRTKLTFLAKRTEKGTWEELERHVRRPTRQQACNPNSPYYSLLGRPHQRALAKAFGFDVEWPEWRDPQRTDRGAGRGIDTAEAFRKRLDRDVPVGNGMTPQPQGFADELVQRSGQLDVAEDAQPADEQQTRGSGAARRADEEIKAGSRGAAVTPMGTMAQVALELGQPAGPGAHQVLVEVSCHSTNIISSNRRFSVRRALLAIDCGEGQGRREAIAGINGIPVQLNNANGETTFAWCGTTKLLRWDVKANGARIGYLWFDAGIIEQLAHGDVLRVSLSAWLKHIDIAEDESEPTFGILDTDDRLLEQPDTTLAIDQQRLIEHLNKLRLAVDANGYAEIAAGEIEVVRKP